MPAPGKQMPVELGVCLANSSWSRQLVFIAEATPKNQIKAQATLAYLDKDHDVIVEHTWVQCYGDVLRDQLKVEEV